MFNNFDGDFSLSSMDFSNPSATTSVDDNDPWAAIRNLSASSFYRPQEQVNVLGQNGERIRGGELQYDEAGKPVMQSGRWQLNESEFLSNPLLSPYQSKFNQLEDLGSGNFRATFQQPGAHKYDTLQATYGTDPLTGNYVLQGTPSATRQESSASKGWKAAAVPAAWMLGGAGIGELAGLGAGGALPGATAAQTFPVYAGGAGWVEAPLAASAGGSAAAAGASGGSGATTYPVSPGGEGWTTSSLSGTADPVGSYITGTGGAEGSLSNPSFWKTVPGQASKGALFNGGMTAAGGGDLSDVLKSAAIGGISGGIGGYAGQAYGGAVGGAAGAATNTALRGGTLSDVAKSGALGGLSQYTPDVAGRVGVTNPMASEAINSAARGAVGATIGGGDVSRAALSGGLQGLFNAGLDTILPAKTTGDTTVNPFFSNLRSSLGLDNVTGKDVGDFAQGLAGVYTGYQQRKQAKDLMSIVGARRGAYETQLRNNLARKDAAAGRRSDYAGRETQLQAALAELDSRNAPGMQQLMNAKLGGQTSILQSLLRLGGKQDWFGSQAKPNMPDMAAFNMPPANPSDPYDLASIVRRQQPQFPWGG